MHKKCVCGNSFGLHNNSGSITGCKDTRGFPFFTLDGDFFLLLNIFKKVNFEGNEIWIYLVSGPEMEF